MSSYASKSFITYILKICLLFYYYIFNNYDKTMYFITKCIFITCLHVLCVYLNLYMFKGGCYVDRSSGGEITLSWL